MDDPLDSLFWRDELLQIMYWFRGEGLGEAVTPRDLLKFLDADEAQLRQHLERLVADQYAARLDGVPVRYQLTELGIKEGGRRFADEFADMTKQGHGECNNPKCSCKTLGPAACESRHPHTH
ncbi:MAG: hypothetical protein M3220_14995 [Chloroflexota bacterium]|nr:hypothetical protein [Chloroflexota bacterium]